MYNCSYSLVGLHYPALLNLVVHRAPDGGSLLSFFLSFSPYLLPTSPSSILSLSSINHCRCAVTGMLSSILLIDHSLNWYYLSVVVAALSLVWVVCLRALALHSLQNHKTRYKLSESRRYTSLNGKSGGSHGGAESPSKANGGITLGLSGGYSVGGGGVSRESSKERLKFDLHPTAMMTSCSQLPLKNLVRQPPIL